VAGPVSEPPSPHGILNPEGLPPPKGFAHAVVAAPGRMVYLGGQAGHKGDGTLAGESLLDQFDQACRSVVQALAAAGGSPEHLVSMQIFVTDPEDYRSNLREIGHVYREHFGHHYPAMGLFGVTELFDPTAKVELMCVAVVPGGAASDPEMHLAGPTLAD